MLLRLHVSDGELHRFHDVLPSLPFAKFRGEFLRNVFLFHRNVT